MSYLPVMSPQNQTQPNNGRELEGASRERWGRITLGERLVALGQTGSGKTTLVMSLLDKAIPPRLPVVVIDPKNAIEPPGEGWRVVEELPRDWEMQVRRRKRPQFLRLIVRPFLRSYPESKVSSPALNTIWARLWEQTRFLYDGRLVAPTLAYVDEIKLCCDGNRAHWTLERLVQQGRQPGIMLWGGTQRPSLIPRMFLSEADHRIVFRLIDRDDRDRASEFMGEPAKEPPGPGEHDFWYMAPGVATLEPMLVHQ